MTVQQMLSVMEMPQESFLLKVLTYFPHTDNSKQGKREGLYLNKITQFFNRTRRETMQIGACESGMLIGAGMQIGETWGVMWWMAAT